MWRILEVLEASKSKFLKGLDKTAADDVDGFEALHKIFRRMERGWVRTRSGVRKLAQG